MVTNRGNTVEMATMCWGLAKRIFKAKEIGSKKKGRPRETYRCIKGASSGIE